MSERIHIVVDRAEKERFRRLAEREGKSLSEWLRDAAREKLNEAQNRRGLETLDALHEFFASCDLREHGREPDWEAHREVIERSRTSAASGT